LPPAILVKLGKMLTPNDYHHEKVYIPSISTPTVLERIPDEMIRQEFSALYEATIAYTKLFYTSGPTESGGASQLMIEQASAGVLLPWPQILDLLNNERTRLGILAMCIARTMLSRSLLLKLGAGNNSGATFLPPEIMDCFQSFCSGKSITTLDGREPEPMNFALLTRWKQISAILLHSTYVADAFSSFDGRTMNIERAIEDLGPLLTIYAIPDKVGREKGTRISELRNLLRDGAKFAFTLFSQPYLWRFDWYHDREIEVAEGQLEPSRFRMVKNSTAHSEGKPYTSSLAEIVIWPRLLRFMDENGCRPVGEGRDNVYGEKIYLEHLL
jgi:hypothetical protein